MKKECRGVSRLIWDYTHQLLSEREVDRVEMHIARCSRCRKEVQSYRVTAGVMSAYRSEPEPESKTTWHALRTQLEHVQREASAADAKQSKRSPALPAWMGAIAAGAILASVWSVSQSADSTVPDSLLPQGESSNTPMVSDPPTVVNQPVSAGASQASPESDSMKSKMVPVSYRPVSRRTMTQVAATDASPEELVRRKAAKAVDSKNNKPTISKNKKAVPEKRDVDLSPEAEQIMPQREFVMGGIPTSGPRIIPVSTGSEVDEAPVW